MKKFCFLFECAPMYLSSMYSPILALGRMMKTEKIKLHLDDDALCSDGHPECYCTQNSHCVTQWKIAFLPRCKRKPLANSLSFLWLCNSQVVIIMPFISLINFSEQKKEPHTFASHDAYQKKEAEKGLTVLATESRQQVLKNPYLEGSKSCWKKYNIWLFRWVIMGHRYIYF